MQKLAGQQHRAMELYHLGGVEAWRNNDGKPIMGNTINALMKKGFFTTHDLTERGDQYIAQYVERTQKWAVESNYFNSGLVTWSDPFLVPAEATDQSAKGKGKDIYIDVFSTIEGAQNFLNDA